MQVDKRHFVRMINSSPVDALSVRFCTNASSSP